MPESNKNKGGKTAYIIFHATIDGKSAEEFSAILFQDLPKDIERLYILLNTNGGSVPHGFALYNLLRALPYEVVTHNIGNVDSIGVTFFMGGKTRYAAPNTTFLIHRVRSTIKNEQSETDYLHEKLSSIDADTKRIQKLLSSNSKLTQEELDRLFQIGEVKDAAYALEKGIIHEIRDLELPQDALVFTVKASTPSSENA